MGCSGDDCRCGTPPSLEEQLRITLVNERNENLLLESTNNYVAENSLVIYVLEGNKIESLTQTYGNNGFILEETNEQGVIKNIVLGRVKSAFIDQNQNEILYIINYNGQYSNDTIFMRYQGQPKNVSDRLIEVKLNGVVKNLESKNYQDLLYKELIIVK